jgi:hypothetical protein
MGNDPVYSMTCDISGVVTIAGITNSFDLPTAAGAYDSTFNGAGLYNRGDFYVARLGSTGASLLYSSYVGGVKDEFQLGGVGLDATGAATITGTTLSSNYPTTPGAFDTILDGAFTVPVTRVSMLPIGATRFGGSTPGCGGPLAIGVTSIPQVGNGGFAVTCGGAPPNGLGILGLSDAGLSSPVFIAGASIWIDPLSSRLFGALVWSDALGGAQVSVPIPGIPSLAGAAAYAQFAWPDACASGGISASNALEIVVQP